MIIRESRRGRPKVIDWWIVLCLGTCLLALLSIPFLDDLLALGAEIDPEDLEDNAEGATVLRYMHWGAGVVVFLMAAFMGVGPLLPRREFAWVFGIVQMVGSMLCLGLLGILGALPIMIFWVRTDCRAWFKDRGDEDFEDVFA